MPWLHPLDPQHAAVRRGRAAAVAAWLTSHMEPDWTCAFGGIVLDDDEIDAVRLYVTVVQEDLREFGGELLIERKFSLKQLREGMFGTCDAVIVKCRDGVLRVYD